MSSSRKADARTSFFESELRGIHQEFKAAPLDHVVKVYEDMWAQAKLFGRTPPRPWVIQTLVQAWRVLDKRTPKGR